MLLRSISNISPSRAILAGCFSMIALGACQTPPQPVHKGDAVEGRQVVERLCADCHAIDPGAVSPNRAAPPFSEVLARYGATALAEDLDKAVPVSHLRMPTFYLGEGNAADIVAYLKSLGAKAGPN